MKNEQVKEFFKKTSVKVTGVVLAAAIAVGSIWAANYQATSVPELVQNIDYEEVVTVDEDETPLTDTKVTTSTKTTKKTTTATAKKKATKTYSSTGKATTKTTTKTSTSKTSTSTKKTTTKTAVKTQTTSKYTKGSKKYKKTTTTKTTVTKTVVTTTTASSSSTSGASTASTASTTAKTVEALAPKVDSRVADAWNKLGFSFVINSSVAYSGLFDAKSQTITLKTVDDTVYHELGHFVAFVAGNVDLSSSFVAVYNAEKDLVTSYNKAYVTQSSSEYFAESFKEYTLDAAALKASRPQTYAAIQAALNKITTAQVTKIATVYSAVWN